MTANINARPAPFTRSDYKTLGLAALGGALEIYDFIIFVFFALTLSQLFFPPEMPEWLRLLQSFGIFVTGYLARPLGGILMAHFADRLGRKKVFSLSILMMALPCLLIGIMPTYAQIGYFAPLLLLALRVLQGAAVGGEVPSAWVFVAEHAPVGHRGYALGFLQAGLTFGYLIGALTATFLAQAFTSAQILDYAWRYPFLLGGVFGVIGVWLRRWLSETPVFMAMQAQREAAVELPLRTVDFLHLQHCLRRLGECHTAAVDRSDAMESVDLCDLLRGDGGRGHQQRGVFRCANAASRALFGGWRGMRLFVPRLFL